MTKANDRVKSSKTWRESKQLLLVIVFIAFFVDFMLVTTVVPIIPRFLEEIRHSKFGPSNQTGLVNSNSTIYDSANNETSTIKTNSTLTANHTISKTNQNVNLHDNLQASAEIGILFGSKPFVQLFVNPIVGPITQKIGYTKPMFFGFVVLFFSTLLFAFGESYTVLFIARAVQGIATSCTAVAGMGSLTARYTVQKKRDNAIRLALGGSALGVMFGPPYGGFMYEYFGKKAPFLVLCGLTLLNGALQLLLKQTKKNKTQEDVKPTSLWVLIKDPYILIASVGMFLTCVQFTLYETSLTLWVMDTMNPTRSDLGMMFIPILFGFMLVFNVFGYWCLKIGRWLMAILGFILVGIFFLSIPLMHYMNQLIAPNLGLGIAFGMAQTAIMPEFAYLVDIRHTAVYGNAYAIGDFFQCLGLALGSVCGGIVLKYVGFTWMMIGVAIMSIVYAPFIYLLKNPPVKNKNLVSSGIITIPQDKKLTVSLINNNQTEESKK